MENRNMQANFEQLLNSTLKSHQQKETHKVKPREVFQDLAELLNNRREFRFGQLGELAVLNLEPSQELLICLFDLCKGTYGPIQDDLMPILCHHNYVLFQHTLHRYARSTDYEMIAKYFTEPLALEMLQKFPSDEFIILMAKKTNMTSLDLEFMNNYKPGSVLLRFLYSHFRTASTAMNLACSSELIDRKFLIDSMLFRTPQRKDEIIYVLLKQPLLLQMAFNLLKASEFGKLEDHKQIQIKDEEQAKILMLKINTLHSLVEKFNKDSLVDVNSIKIMINDKGVVELPTL